MKPTIYDIAIKSGVSTATVSKILNNTGRISEDTRRRVLQVVAETGFKPSLAASSLKKKQTFTLGLIIPDVTNPFYSELARAIEDEASKRGYSVLISNTDNNPEREQTQLARLQRSDLDGYLIASSRQHDLHLEQLIAQGSPVVLLDRQVQDPCAAVMSVATDHVAGGRLAGEYLITQGHRDIRVFLEPLHLGPSMERLSGFNLALGQVGLQIEAEHLYTDGYGIAAGNRLARRLLEEKALPSALFIANDLMAIGALQTFQGAGVRLPDDLSIIGYDDILMSSCVYPPLTTVAQPITRMGETAVGLVLGERRADGSSLTHLLAPTLTVRASVKPSAADRSPL